MHSYESMSMWQGLTCSSGFPDYSRASESVNNPRALFDTGIAQRPYPITCLPLTHLAIYLSKTEINFKKEEEIFQLHLKPIIGILLCLLGRWGFWWSLVIVRNLFVLKTFDLIDLHKGRKKKIVARKAKLDTRTKLLFLVLTGSTLVHHQSNTHKKVPIRLRAG